MSHTIIHHFSQVHTMHRLQPFSLILIFCVCSLFDIRISYAQWQPLNEPFGLYISSVFETDGILLASALNGIYRSDDGGRNWTHTYTARTASPQTFVRLGSTIYASTPQGLLTSTDGRIWSLLQSNLPTYYNNLLAYDGSKMYCSVNKSLYSSTDSGAHWTLEDELPAGYISSIASVGSQVFLTLFGDDSGQGSGIFTRSTTGSWTKLSSPATLTLITNIVTIGSTLFAGGWNKIYRSEDSGQTWTKLATPGINSFFESFVSTGSVLFVGSSYEGVFRSTDNGNTWSSTGLQTPGISCLTIQNSEVVVGTRFEGIYISDDEGATWKANNVGLKSNCTVAQMAANNANIYAVDWSRDKFLYKSGDAGITWEHKVLPLTTSTITSLTIANSTLLVGTSLEGVFVSDTSGSFWQHSTGIAPNTLIQSILQDGTNLVAATQQMTSPSEPRPGIYISKDGGFTWTATYQQSPVYSLIRHNGMLYAGLARDIIVSTDGGENWTNISHTPPTTFYVLSSNGSTLFAGFDNNNGIYVSYDNANTWEPVTNGLLGVSKTTSFAVYNNIVFAATNLGVFKTEDNGASWQSISTGIDSILVESLAITDEYLYAGTENKAIWRRPLSEMTTVSVRENTKELSRYSLLPHPVASSSLLQLCSTCELHKATLTLSTMGGQKVRTTANLYGSSVTINKGDLAAGVYVFTLEEAGRVVASGTIAIE